MKNLILILSVVLFMCAPVLAQKVTVDGKGKQISKVPRDGMAVTMQLDKKFVEKLWDKKLKEFGGKKSGGGGATTIEGAKIPSISSSPVKIISVVSSSKDGTEVWWAIDLGSSYVTDHGSSSKWAAAKKIMSQFGLSAYREDVNEEIKEAERALEKAVKNNEKEVKAGTDLVKDIERNGKEKARLEQELKDNASDLVQLKKDVETNKADQAATKKDIVTMEKNVQMTRSKLDKIGK